MKLTSDTILITGGASGIGFEMAKQLMALGNTVIIKPVNCASKTGLHTYTKSLRQHLANTNVKVFELAPPKTSRPMFNRDATGQQESSNRMQEMEVSKVVGAMIKGIRKDKFEILPGMSKVPKLVRRFTL